jgi:outer membrane receptor for ferrienterochelin and colicins
MIKRLARIYLLGIILFLLSATPAQCQILTTGRMTGAVTDQQGGLIPRAEILAKNAATGAEFRANTNQVGVWEIPSIPSGSYTVSVNAQAFRTATFKDINVEADAAITVDATLQIGLADTAVVTASRFEEDVLNAPATASVISEQAIEVLPTHNVADLLRAVPGMNVVQTSARQFSLTSRSASGIMPAYPSAM